MTPAFIFDTIRDSIVDAFGVAPESVTYETKLAADLGADSDRVIRFVFDLARTFDVELIGLADFIFASGGHATKTESELARMRALFPELVDELKPGLRSDAVHRLFDVRVLHGWVTRALAR